MSQKEDDKEQHTLNAKDIEDKRDGCAKCGAGLAIISLVFIIVDIFLVGFQYRQTDQRWTNFGAYFAIGVLEVMYVVFVFAITVFGIVVLSMCKENRRLNITVSIQFNNF